MIPGKVRALTNSLLFGAHLIFLALQSVQNSVSDFQPKQPGYRRDAVHHELACLQSYHWPEQGNGQVSLSEATYAFSWRCNNHWCIRPVRYANAFRWEWSYDPDTFGVVFIANRKLGSSNQEGSKKGHCWIRNSYSQIEEILFCAPFGYTYLWRCRYRFCLFTNTILCKTNPIPESYLYPKW